MEENNFLNAKMTENDHLQIIQAEIDIGEDIPGFETSKIMLQIDPTVFRDTELFHEILMKQVVNQTIEDKSTLTDEDVVIMKFHMIRIVNQFMQSFILRNN